VQKPLLHKGIPLSETLIFSHVLAEGMWRIGGDSSSWSSREQHRSAQRARNRAQGRRARRAGSPITSPKRAALQREGSPIITTWGEFLATEWLWWLHPGKNP
jgi:hypothetical protein